MNPFVLGLDCTTCGQRYQSEPGRYVCDRDAGTLDVAYDYVALASSVPRSGLGPDQTMWRYRPLLPIGVDTPVPALPIGGTPLVDATGARPLGGRLWIKDEGRQPTASLKDRASAIAAVKASEERAEVVTTASTGNAAAALAGVCASTGQRAVIFVPAAAPEAKIAQLLAYGATVLLVEGSYGDAFDLCMRAAAEFGWYNRNTGHNPYVGEGKKTVALEILEQLGWVAPGAVFVSVGDGSIIGGVHKGLKDALALRWIDSMPRIFGVQAAGSDFLTQAFERAEDVLDKPAINASTVADSISADLPRDRVKAMKAVVETAGRYLRVSDEAILAAIPEWAAKTGVFSEPAAAAAFAGLSTAIAAGWVNPEESVVVISTGSGLKDVRSAMRGVEGAGRRAQRVPVDALPADLLASIR